MNIIYLYILSYVFVFMVRQYIWLKYHVIVMDSGYFISVYLPSFNWQFGSYNTSGQVPKSLLKMTFQDFCWRTSTGRSPFRHSTKCCFSLLP